MFSYKVVWRDIHYLYKFTPPAPIQNKQNTDYRKKLEFFLNLTLSSFALSGSKLVQQCLPTVSVGSKKNLNQLSNV